MLQSGLWFTALAIAWWFLLLIREGIVGEDNQLFMGLHQVAAFLWFISFVWLCGEVSRWAWPIMIGG